MHCPEETAVFKILVKAVKDSVPPEPDLGSDHEIDGIGDKRFAFKEFLLHYIDLVEIEFLRLLVLVEIRIGTCSVTIGSSIDLDRYFFNGMKFTNRICYDHSIQQQVHFCVLPDHGLTTVGQYAAIGNVDVWDLGNIHY